MLPPYPHPLRRPSLNYPNSNSRDEQAASSPSRAVLQGYAYLVTIMNSTYVATIFYSCTNMYRYIALYLYNRNTSGTPVLNPCDTLSSFLYVRADLSTQQQPVHLQAVVSVYTTVYSHYEFGFYQIPGATRCRNEAVDCSLLTANCIRRVYIVCTF